MANSVWQRFEGTMVDGKYLLHKLLGSGGNGSVFDAEPLAEDTALKHVALKLMEPAPGHEEQQLQDISGLAGLTHPSLLRTFTPGFCTIDTLRLLYLPMEMADESLDSRISTHPMSLDDARDAATAVAAALVYLHEQYRPLVHRDVKPSNTMRTGARWKLGDFGLLRAIASRNGVRTRTFVGTAEYAPPESYDGIILPAWDVWSLGVLLHETAARRHPFAGAETPQQLMHAVCSLEPTLSTALPAEFKTIVTACLDKDPSVRWTAARVLEALEELDTGSSHYAKHEVHVSRRRQQTTSHAETVAPFPDSLSPSEPLSDRLTVSASGDADCITILEAVRRTAAGATILVKPGRYSGTVQLNQQVEIVGVGALADIVFEGIGREALIINSAGVRICGITLISRSDINQPKHNCVTVRTGPTRIERYDISCNSLAGIAVLTDAMDVTISDCTIHDCKAAGALFEEHSSGIVLGTTLPANFGPALHVKSGGELVIQLCRILDGRESGVLLDRSAICSIQSCSIHDNGVTGVIVQESATITLTDCEIYANKHAGVAARAGSTASLTECDIHANLLSGATFSGTQARLLRCKVRNSRSNGLVVSDGGLCTLEDTEVSSNGFAGIKVSHAGELRAVSSHMHSGKRNAAVIQDDGYAIFTACDIHGNGQASVLVEEGGRAALLDCRLHDSEEGCIASSGTVTLERCTLYGNGKSAVETLHGGNAFVRDCTLESNRMPAILVHGKSEATIERCEITRNDMPGIAVGESSKALISECTVRLGAQVGMVFWDRARGIVDRCEITECGMDGIRLMQQTDPVISGSRIHANGQFGIHVSGQSAGEITDCELTSNASGPAYIEAGCTTTSSGNRV